MILWRMAAAQTPGKAAARSRPARSQPARSQLLRWAKRVFLAVFILVVPLPALLLLIFRVMPVPGTPQMLASWLRGDGVHYSWADDHIAPALARAVIASEDQKFCSHHGFDWGSIDGAMHTYEEGGRLRGASTISQQTARSLFLFPVRSWIRKGLEAGITVVEEALWPKQRILTVYLNVVDWGHGNFGAEAAAHDYFHRSAAALSLKQTARLAAVLPDPDDWRAARPGPYVAARTALILRRMVDVRRDRLDSCLHP